MGHRFPFWDLPVSFYHYFVFTFYCNFISLSSPCQIHMVEWNSIKRSFLFSRRCVTSTDQAKITTKVTHTDLGCIPDSTGYLSTTIELVVSVVVYCTQLLRRQGLSYILSTTSLWTNYVLRIVSVVKIFRWNGWSVVYRSSTEILSDRELRNWSSRKIIKLIFVLVIIFV